MDMTRFLENLNLKAFRYGVLGIFLLYNALIASLAVWNLGLVHGFLIRLPLQEVDSYLAFVGCSGLVLSFVVSFVELAHKFWFIGRVWFECLWVALWGLMYLTGGTALTVTASRQDCITTNQTPRCVSMQVLLAFTWLCAMTLIVYFIVLMFAIVINKKKDPAIWHSMMRKFPWSGTCATLFNSPPTPTLPHFRNTVPIIHAPKPKHARPNGRKREPIFSYRSGLSHEYQIEHYRPPSIVEPATRQPRILKPPAAAALPVIRPPVIPSMETDTADSFVSSLYPLYMQRAISNANLVPLRPEAVLTQDCANAASQVARAPTQAALPASPPPLGSWPQSDILSQPTSRGKRKQPPQALQLDRPSEDAGVLRSPVGTKHRDHGAHGGQLNPPSSYSPMRPMGPRRRSGSSDMTSQRLVLA